MFPASLHPPVSIRDVLSARPGATLSGRFPGVFRADMLTGPARRRPKIALRRPILSEPPDLADLVRISKPRLEAGFRAVGTCSGSNPTGLKSALRERTLWYGAQKAGDAAGTHAGQGGAFPTQPGAAPKRPTRPHSRAATLSARRNSASPYPLRSKRRRCGRGGACGKAHGRRCNQ